MNVLEEYRPLYDSDFFQVDCFGGRAGARSYSITQFSLYQILYNQNFRGFYVRQVHSTIYASMWADFKDRVKEYEEMHGVDLSNIIEVSDNKNGENYARNKKTGASISTKGFSVSNKKNTASLKSLAGATHLFIDEAEETDLDDFRKLKLSFRKKDIKIQILRAFNPPFRGHWIWNDYNLKKVEDSELLSLVLNASSVDPNKIKKLVKTNNKTYYRAELKEGLKEKGYLSISTNFTHNYRNLNESVFDEYDKILLDDFHYYCVHILGLIPNEQGDLVYNDYSRDGNNSFREIKPNDVLHIGMDFNITQMSAVVHVVDAGIEIAVDELTEVYDTNTMADLILQTYPGYKIVVYPDASGQNRKTSGSSDVDILRKKGLKVRARSANPPVRDRINAVNTKFRKKTYLVNYSKCPSYSEALEKLKYKNGEPDKKSGFDHVTDAGGYYAYDSVGGRIKKRSSNVF